jgi:hypothetical protein
LFDWLLFNTNDTEGRINSSGRHRPDAALNPLFIGDRMMFKKIGLGVFFVLVATLGQASASIVLDSDATGGWSNGTGTFNGHFTLDE